MYAVDMIPVPGIRGSVINENGGEGELKYDIFDTL
jgi:hypothetical protein